MKGMFPTGAENTNGRFPIRKEQEEMATSGNRNDSEAQRRKERDNRANGGDRVPGVDKKLNGPNRPAE